MIRTFAHDNILRLAKASSVPVINALTDLLHPCQAMADFFTLVEHKGSLGKLKLAWSGDGNNVCHSLMLAAAKAGTKFAAAVPKGYEPDPDDRPAGPWRTARRPASSCSSPTTRPRRSRTPTPSTPTSGPRWARKPRRKPGPRIFAPYQVNDALMAKAKPDAVFMHCLPAHRGEEVTASVFDSPRSIVFDQAENRLHVQKAIMLTLMGKKESHG